LKPPCRSQWRTKTDDVAVAVGVRSLAHPPGADGAPTDGGIGASDQYVEHMPEPVSDPEPTPVAPPPIETAPFATGLVDGDESELREAMPSPDAGEE
jgi:hypothetical protein